MRTKQILRPAGMILALLTPFLLAQQDDTPVVITDGSLKIISEKVPWSQWTGSGDIKHHPHAGKSISSVEVTINGATLTPFALKKQYCKVDVTWGTDHIVFETDSTGKGLSMSPDTKFHNGADVFTREHNDASKAIAHVTVTSGAGNLLDQDVTSGKTTVRFHYKTM